MHVLLLSTSYPDSRSGNEAAGGFVQDFAQELARHVRVTVVAATEGESSVRTEERLRVHRFGVRRWPLSLLNPLNPLHWWPAWSTLRDGLRATREAAAVGDVDYVLALWALPSGFWARAMQKRFGIPYGIWALGSDIWGLGRVPLLRSYLKHVLAHAEDRYADGLQLADDVTRICGKPCGFLPSARRMPPRQVTTPASEPPYRLAFLGRWHPNKGIDLLLEGLAQLSTDDWAHIAEIRIRGGGPLEAEVHRRVAQLQAQGYPITVAGYLDTAGAAELMSWADYVVLPSRVESIPVVFSDAAQMRRPLIATPVGDLPRLFDEYRFGVLASEVTAEAIAQALAAAVRTPASGFDAQLGRVADQFDIARVALEFARRLEDSES